MEEDLFIDKKTGFLIFQKNWTFNKVEDEQSYYCKCSYNKKLKNVSEISINKSNFGIKHTSSAV